jgi:hypothetical protein
MATITLDRDALDLARAVVDRERPTPRQEARFDWTARLIVATFLLVVVWVVTAIRAPSYQQPFLFGAALTCTTANTLFALNAGFVSRLWRSFWTAKRLGLHWRHAKRPSMRRAWLACLAVIHLFGYPLLLAGGSGLEVEMEQGDPVDFLAAFSVVSFGVGCLLLLPMEVVRGRVNAMRALRGALDATQPPDAGKVELPAPEYDRITDLQFQHAVIDSHASLTNDTGLDADAGPALRLRQAFQETVANLPGAQSDLVYDVIGELDGRFELANAAPDGDILMPVPDTRLQIRLRRHPLRNEIEVVALETASPHGRPSSHG